jgi:multimeric flavodoxin WrbA
MKVVAFNGSARRDGNTAILLNEVLRQLVDAGVKTELIQLAGKKVAGCRACGQCSKRKDGQCVFTNDGLNEWLALMESADGILLGSPTYFSDVTAEMKALIDRTGMVAKANDDLFKFKVGAAVVAVRRGGAVHVFESMNQFFLINQMIIPGSSYWNIGFGLQPGDVEQDREGMETMRTLGHNMAWLLQKIHAVS